MSFELSLLNNSALIARQAAQELLACNERTAQYGLILTPAQALALTETRSESLRANGRVEFGGGVMSKIVLAFRDSPYLTPQNYEQTLHELIECFYVYKNETLDRISDDELIAAMKEGFDGVCQGSVELLSGRHLYKLARGLRGGAEDDDD